jgi:hypothetical protein
MHCGMMQKARSSCVKVVQSVEMQGVLSKVVSTAAARDAALMRTGLP